MEENITEYCNNCKGHTPHIIKAKGFDSEIYDYPEHTEIFWFECSYTLACSLCKQIFSKVRMWNKIPYKDPLSGFTYIKNDYSEKYYPPRLVNTLSEKEFGSMLPIIKKAYQEVIYCYNNDKLIICSAGIKTLTEGICRSFQRDIKDKIDISSLCQNALGMTFLEAIKYSTNLGLHGSIFEHLYHTNKAELRIVIEALEELMSKLYPLSQNREK